MSMSLVKRWSDEFPRSGLIADGPDWDKGVDTDIDPSTGKPLPDELRIMTKQSFADECDINSIMARYEKTGMMPEGRRMYEFGEAISEYSYQESLNAIIAGEQLFGSLPAKVRDRFGNDPAALLRFLDDPKNKDEAIELGIVDPPKPKAEPMEVRVVAEPPPKQAAAPAASVAPAGATA